METQTQTPSPTTPPPPSQAKTERPDIDQGLAKLKEASTKFVKLGIPERLQLLRQMLDGYVAIAEDSVRAGLAAKGIDPSTPLAAEEWLAGPSVVVRNLRLLIDTLERIQQGLPSIDPGRIRTQKNGRVAIDVFPTSGLDKVMFGGFRAEVRMKEGVGIDDVLKRAAIHYKTPVDERKPGVALVLGAGNVASIPPTDVLYKMFVEGKVCVLKMNPVNAHVGPFIEKAWHHLIDAGYLTVVYGAGDVGAYLVDHPGVDEIHITGSDKTHDMMVWGPPGAEREERKKNKNPRLTKPITSELGNVSPVIVVPGPYDDKELTFQGQSICAAIANNASFNCNSAKLLVQAEGWSLREPLRNAMKAALAATPLRKAYYPGAEDRWKLLVDSHPTAERVGEPKPGELPWAVIPKLDPNDAAEKAFEMEPWCSVISETAVGSTDPIKFLEAAVQFVNDKVWGTLSATIVIHPKTLKEPGVAEALEKAINELRYGTVCINHWPALGFAFGSTPWGGHPSATLENIQSGKGWVHNTYLINDDDLEKCVIFGPLVAKPKPVWFAGHKTADVIGKKMVAMEAAPSVWKLPGIIMAALKG